MNANEQTTPPYVTVIALVVLAALSVAFVFGCDAILPTRIDEGPLVQEPGPGRTALVWYTTWPAECELTVEGLTADQISLSSSESDTRHLAELSGLANAQTYDYRITLAGEGRELFSGTLETPPAEGAPIEFIVFGDSGKGTRVQYALAQQMLQREPDFMLHTGDLVYGDGARHKYPARFFGPYREIIARVPFFPCLGNHDVAIDGTALPYESVFELPQNGPVGRRADHEYWFDFGPARIAVLDSNVSQQEMETYFVPWLREVFEPNAPEWRIVSFHHPPYTAGNYKGDLAVRKTLVPVLEEVGVDVVFNGHDHNYQRLEPIRDGQVAADGIQYIITGAGGARLYEVKRAEAEHVVVFDNVHHSATFVRIDGETMSLEQFDTEGEVIDAFEITSVAAGAENSE